MKSIEDIKVGEVFSAYIISISTDERKSKQAGVFLNESVGLRSVEGKGWYGSSGWSNTVKCVKLSDGSIVRIGQKVSIDTSENYEESAKQAALQKLTAEDRQLLGL